MTAIGPAAYSAAVWRRFCAPANAAYPEAGISACVADTAHQIELCLHCSDGVYSFSAVGCPTTIAAADFCAEALNAGERPDAHAMMNGLEIAEDRRHCVLLCEDAMVALRARMAQTPTAKDRKAS